MAKRQSKDDKKAAKLRIENDLLELEDWLNAFAVHESNCQTLVLDENGIRDIRMYLMVARHTLRSYLESVDATKH